MFRSAAAAATILAIFVSVAPAMAADADLKADVKTGAAPGTAGSMDLVSDTDWSLKPVRVGASQAASRGGLLPALYVSLAGLNVFDAYTTRTGLSRGAVESNPVLHGVAGNSAALFAVKGGTTAASIFFAERLWRQHRRAEAIAVMVVSNGIMAGVAGRNASILRQVR